MQFGKKTKFSSLARNVIFHVLPARSNISRLSNGNNLTPDAKIVTGESVDRNALKIYQNGEEIRATLRMQLSA